ncbi:serine protease [Mesobacillus boroniphilus]|uniref:Serine protease n=1 Tax=Mesobacillus boroniphilus TaxID=308892 RepID=A0A944GV62_9BACI|nr:S1C family serine protease [Mesobacillus boroniphilus]MBS8263154.1 serine protease [Mesobacillus boroniphilus]
MDNRKDRNFKSVVLTGVVGLMIGAILMLLIDPFSPGKGFLSKENADEKITMKANADEGEEEPSIKEAVAESINTVVSVVKYEGGNMWEGAEPEKAGSGSGVIYKKENDKAYIVTNHHVISGASQIEISLEDETKLEAKLLGSDPLLDLAVLEVDGGEIEKVIEIGDSSKLEPGATAIAIGNPLGFLHGTITAGVVSSPDRVMPVDINQDGSIDWQSEVIQTDASINPGNSGGALINIHGELIGINSSKIAQEAVEGIGFSIPIDVAMPILQDLQEHGEVLRPYIGIVPISLTDIPSQYYSQTLNLPEGIEDGVVIREIVSTSPAGMAGLKQYDVITKLDDTEIKTGGELRKFLYTEKEIGDDVVVTFYRNGKEETATLTLQEDFAQNN